MALKAAVEKVVVGLNAGFLGFGLTCWKAKISRNERLLKPGEEVRQKKLFSEAFRAISASLVARALRAAPRATWQDDPFLRLFAMHKVRN